MRHLARAENRVDLGNLRPQLVAIALGQAAGHDQRWHAPVFLCSAISRMVSIDSCFALSMNAQVLTMSTSASAASRVSWCPCFLGEPQHHLGVDEVLGAAERNHSNLHSMRYNLVRIQVIAVSADNPIY